ncbi:MAG: UDP-N-acetylmuramoyl-L-alanyl-D-glutamate--2,6-diaminopimelate ligase [Gammaproteobacteria bacterium]|nr:UDP-N-acetylmuramoyl-L-alanyl-D-glutamate--2,6-diaminopimelate ligase [Gammaproteobacteria bacterium]
MTNQLPLARSSNMLLAKPNNKNGEKQYPHNHLQSLLDGFVDFSGVENCTLTFKGLSINSKKVHEDFLFLACGGVGKNPHHGIAYAGEAINQGASCIVWEPTDEVKNMPDSCPAERENKSVNIPLIQVKALHKNIGEIASRFYQHPSHSLRIIGVTGTNGKTSTAHFIAQLIHEMNNDDSREEKKGPCAVIGTLGNGLYGQLEQSTHTTPDAVTLQELIAGFRDAKAQALVMEVSSHALAQGRVNGVEFDCAILTNLTRDHLDYHGDMKTYADEKLKLFHFSSLKYIILNKDDSFSDQILRSITESSIEKDSANEMSLKSSELKASIVCYSRVDNHADYYADNILMSSDGISFTLTVNKESVVSVKSHLVGDFNIENLLASIAALHLQGYELNKIVSGIEKLRVVPGRMEKIIFQENGMTSKKPLIVIDYAHTPDALEKGLSALQAHTKGKLICLFGCGGDRDKGKRPLMAKVAQQYADKIIVTSDNPRTESAERIIDEIARGFNHLDNVITEINRKKAIYLILQLMEPDDVLLIAGKGHEDYQEVNGQRFPFSDKGSVLSFYESKGNGSGQQQEAAQ